VLRARLAAPVVKPSGLTVFLRARSRLAGGALEVEPLPTQASGNLSSVTGFDALAVLPPDATHLRRGAAVDAILVRAPHGG
jgi:molybdopterin biosynthesis enzyme